LSVIHKFYGLDLLDYEFILNIVVSPEDESSLLLKRCVECSTLGDDGKSSNTCKWFDAFTSLRGVTSQKTATITVTTLNMYS